MKRYVSFFALALFLAILLSSCAKAVTADGLAYRILNLFPSLPPCSQYITNGEPYTAGYLSPEACASLYTGKETRLPEWDCLEEFRLILSDSPTFFEIHILRTVSASDTEKVAKLLERRAALIRLHNKTEPSFPASDPIVLTRGCFAILLATDDNESVVRLLEKLL